MNEITVGILSLVLLLLLFATGIELGFAMALVGFVGFAYLNGFQPAMQLVGRDIYEVITNYGYTVFPLFILMVQVGFNAGIAQRLYDAAHKFIGHIPGGLAMATVLGATGFKTICGSSAATAATFASVAIPEMDRYGYHSAVYRKTFCRRDYPGINHSPFIPGDHLWMGKDQSKDCPYVRAVNMEGKNTDVTGGYLDHPCFSPSRRGDHVGLVHTY